MGSSTWRLQEALALTLGRYRKNPKKKLIPEIILPHGKAELASMAGAYPTSSATSALA